MSKKNISRLMGKPDIKIDVKSYNSKRQAYKESLMDVSKKSKIPVSYITPAGTEDGGLEPADETHAKALTDYLEKYGLSYCVDHMGGPLPFATPADKLNIIMGRVKAWEVKLNRMTEYYASGDIPDEEWDSSDKPIAKKYMKELSADVKSAIIKFLPFYADDKEIADDIWLCRMSSLILIHTMLGLYVYPLSVKGDNARMTVNSVNDVVGIMATEVKWPFISDDRVPENLPLFMSEIENEENFVSAYSSKTVHDYVYRSENGRYKPMSDEEALEFFIRLVESHGDVAYAGYLEKVGKKDREKDDKAFNERLEELKAKEDAAERKVKEAEEQVSQVEEKLALYRKSFLKIGKTDKEIKEMTEGASANSQDDKMLKADYDASVAEMERQITKLREKLEKSVSENRELLDELKLISPDETYEAELKTDIKEIDYNKRYVFVLQTRQTLELEKVLYETFPNCVVTDNTNTINGGCDLAVLFTKWISHSLYSGAKRICRDNKIEFVHCPYSNIEMVKQVIWTYYNS